MKIYLDTSVFALAPDFVRYVLVAENVRNAVENSQLLAMLRSEEAAIRADESLQDEKKHPRIASWRELFAAFDVNANKCPPSVANLIKRVRSGKDMPFVNALVCIFNIISLRHRIPAGGDDLAVVAGDVALKAATGTEVYIPLGARESSTAEHPKAGEIVLLDTGSNTVFCRAWCWKNGDTSKITPESTRVAINLDILSPVSREEGAAIAATVKELLETHCGAAVTVHCLDAASPSVVIA